MLFQTGVFVFQAELQVAIDNSEAEVRSHPRMYMPGVVLYIQETDRKTRYVATQGAHSRTQLLKQCYERIHVDSINGHCL